MITVGQPAPDFKLKDQGQQMVSISQFKGNKNVVLSAHKFSFTGG